MTSVARRSGPARQAGAGASPGTRPGPPRRPAGIRLAVRGWRRRRPGALATGPARVGERGALTVIITGAVVVLGLWWHSTPGVHGLGGWLTGAGRSPACSPATAVVVLLALMARVPPLERGSAPTGWPAGTPWAAGTSVSLVGRARRADHLGLRGHGARRRRQRDARRCSLSYPDVLMATVGRVPAASRRHRVGTGRPAAAALRDVVLPAPLHLPGHRPRVQPPVRHGVDFVTDLARAVLWSAFYVVVAASCCCGTGCRVPLRRRSAATACGSSRWWQRGARCHVGLHRRQAARRARTPSRASSSAGAS